MSNTWQVVAMVLMMSIDGLLLRHMDGIHVKQCLEGCVIWSARTCGAAGGGSITREVVSCNSWGLQEPRSARTDSYGPLGSTAQPTVEAPAAGQQGSANRPN